jgi:uncharacterized protein with NAD-binding domain and iron-sulfur cluster
MSFTTKPQLKKIAILGGGISSLSAAFDLTSESDWRNKYEITVYQMGWRLGGKGASSRNPECGNRIEEHGLHIWIGFYENAFALMRKCYEERGSQGGTFPSWKDAFKPHSFLVLEEHIPNGWMHWPINVPTNDSLPGDGQELPTIWDYTVMALQWIREWLEPRQIVSNQQIERATVAKSSADAMGQQLSAKERSSPRLGLKLIRTAERRARRMPRNSAKHKPQDRQTLLSLILDFANLIGTSLPEGINTDPNLRRTWITIDLFVAAVRGVLKDDVLNKGLDQLDGMDFRMWLQKHGAADITVNSALIRAAYDLAFSFENGDPAKMNLAAGVGMRALFRMVFTYKGAILWKMQAGMGETVFTPLYHVLRARGVKFQFFNCVESLQPSADQKEIGQIGIWRQAHCKNGDYQPLIRVNDLDCWHYGPDFDQLQEGEELKANSINLESNWTPWKGGEHITLAKGQDFDTVILGIPIEGLKQICKSIIQGSPRWQSMTEKVKTIQTQAFQLWLDKDLSQCGWDLQSPILGAYVEPLDTWADMSHLLAVESWPGGSRPSQIAYFCGVMQTADDLAPRDDFGFPKVEMDRCKAKAIDFLSQYSAHLWPRTSEDSNPASFQWSLLASSSASAGVNRFDSQYWRANIDPSERYVLALAGTTESRLRTTESGFSNLFLAGDWIRNGFNSPGCIESAVISGRQAARAVSGSKNEIIGESDFTASHGLKAWIREQIQNALDMVALAFDKETH